MGLLANTVSICQFHVLGQRPAADLFSWAGECLRKSAFQPIDRSAEELSFGWVHLDDPRVGSFADMQAFRRDHYLTFSLRRDQRRIPATLLRDQVQQAEAEFLSSHPGLQRVPKQKREEIREAVRGVLLSRVLPAPAVFDAVWDTRSDILTFASLNAKVIEMFEGLFRTTFEGLRLVTVHPFGRAEGLLEDDFRERLRRANQATSDSVLDLIQGNRWLGRDFLRWLIFQTTNGSSEYRVDQPGPAEGDNFTAYIDDRLVLVAGGESGPQKITVAGPQDRFGEVQEALRNGKEIQEGILYLDKRENLWKVLLKGETFHFASFRAPGVKLEKDDLTDPAREKEALFFERMAVMEEGLQLFDSLYGTFLRDRLGDHWATKERNIQSWLEKD